MKHLMAALRRTISDDTGPVRNGESFHTYVNNKHAFNLLHFCILLILSPFIFLFPLLFFILQDEDVSSSLVHLVHTDPVPVDTYSSCPRLGAI